MLFVVETASPLLTTTLLTAIRGVLDLIQAIEYFARSPHNANTNTDLAAAGEATNRIVDDVYRFYFAHRRRQGPQ